MSVSAILAVVCVSMMAVGLFLIHAKRCKLGMALYLGGVVVVLCVIVIGVVIPFKIEVSRAHRTHVLTGSAIEVPEVGEKTDKCVRTFKFRYRDGKLDKRLPYTFEVECDTVVRNGDVMELTFVAPKNVNGKPAVLDIINYTYEIEKYSAPASLSEMPWVK
mgnify:FL=1